MQLKLFDFLIRALFNGLHRLSFICKEEGIVCEESVLKTLIKACGGDMRRAITSLQSCARLKSSQEITVDDVYEVAGIVPGFWLERFMEICKSNDTDKLMKFIEELTLEGYSAFQVRELDLCILISV